MSPCLFNNKKDNVHKDKSLYDFDLPKKEDDIIIQKNNDTKKNVVQNNNFIYNNKKKITLMKDNHYHKDNNINSIFSTLKCKNIKESLIKIGALMKSSKFIDDIKLLYNKYDQKNASDINLNEIFDWINNNAKENIKYKKEYEKYKIFCDNLMKEFGVNEFDNFKNFILNTVSKNKKNTNFVCGMKKILCASHFHNNMKKKKKMCDSFNETSKCMSNIDEYNKSRNKSCTFFHSNINNNNNNSLINSGQNDFKTKI